ncbi:YdcF family protein [Aureliella helgolandensis]|uniref:DUF218 domain-containing protein n=1 Tax=Aureliella helgolandensis TaxID=2527968 RepID=A0A518GE29_9BACT|nr:YdcF family protein [Aureliella helgolandensis]QDV26855.1 hypothetical protein Q31a_52340 [Aureliella helgolandensis]
MHSPPSSKPIPLQTPSWSSYWLRKSAYLFAAWVCLVGLPSFPIVRACLTLPLYCHNPGARGDTAYVMADGYAYLERLRAAADLYHMHRVKEIYLLNETRSHGYNFVLERSQSTSESASNYLKYLGVPPDSVHLVDADASPLMGSLNEAQAFAANTQDLTGRVVVVTSAPHTRRSLLCFQRSLPAERPVTIYSASLPEDSAELNGPIWQEYLKLLIYYCVA